MTQRNVKMRRNSGTKSSKLSLTERLISDDLEVKSFIYQQIAEFQPFVTPTTVAAVVAKNPLNLKLDYELAGKDFDFKALSKSHRIQIHLRDNQSEIFEEATHENIYEAIRMAKTKLYKKLVKIQDSVISKKDRIDELQQALTRPKVS